MTEAQGYDVDAEKYEGSGAQVGRTHPLFLNLEEFRKLRLLLFYSRNRTAEKT